MSPPSAATTLGNGQSHLLPPTLPNLKLLRSRRQSANNCRAVATPSCRSRLNHDRIDPSSSAYSLSQGRFDGYSHRSACFHWTLPGRLRSPDAIFSTPATQSSGAWRPALICRAAVTPSQDAPTILASGTRTGTSCPVIAGG